MREMPAGAPESFGKTRSCSLSASEKGFPSCASQRCPSAPLLSIPSCISRGPPEIQSQQGVHAERFVFSYILMNWITQGWMLSIPKWQLSMSGPWAVCRQGPFLAGRGKPWCPLCLQLIGRGPPTLWRAICLTPAPLI